jgi:hypothetical protein
MHSKCMLLTLLYNVIVMSCACCLIFAVCAVILLVSMPKADNCNQAVKLFTYMHCCIQHQHKNRTETWCMSTPCAMYLKSTLCISKHNRSRHVATAAAVLNTLFSMRNTTAVIALPSLCCNMKSHKQHYKQQENNRA